MTPTEVKAAFAAAGLSTKGVGLPTCSVSGVAINNGTQARCFAGYMRTDALEATKGQTFSEMGMYLTPAGKETSEKADAALKEGKPVANTARPSMPSSKTPRRRSTACSPANLAHYLAHQAIWAPRRRFPPRQRLALTLGNRTMGAAGFEPATSRV